MPAPRLDTEFYRTKSWGTVPIRAGRDLPSLKLQYLLEFLGRQSAQNLDVLEVGCGSGRILASLRERVPALRLSGLDLSAAQIALARDTHPSISFTCGNGEALPFADASFDGVLFFDYLEHIENPRQSLTEIHRVLRPGGWLYFVCPAERQSIYGLSHWIFRRHFKASTAGHIQQFSRQELERLTASAGFAIAERRYSYHLLGSLMDYALFAAMLHPAVYAKYWSLNGNPYYATAQQQSPRGWFQHLLRLGNAIAYQESHLLRAVAFGATAVHLTSRKPFHS